MAYRGEDIGINVKGTAQHNLDVQNFTVLVYPDGHPEASVNIPKSNMEQKGENYYSGFISHEISKTMALGYYTIEVLVTDTENGRSIFASKGAFPLYDSASKDI